MGLHLLTPVCWHFCLYMCVAYQIKNSLFLILLRVTTAMSMTWMVYPTRWLIFIVCTIRCEHVIRLQHYESDGAIILYYIILHYGFFKIWNHKLLSISQAYVNMALFENFTYAGIDATAEEAWLPAPPDPSMPRSPKRKSRGWSPRYCHLPAAQRRDRRTRRSTKTTQL